MGELEFTTQMDNLSQIMMSQYLLVYPDKGDRCIAIAVPLVIVQMLVVSGCVLKLVENNVVVNYFMETHWLKINIKKII